GRPPGAAPDARGGPGPGAVRQWSPGQDVRHAEHGPGWVQGSGVGRVTVRFEVPRGEIGRVRTFRVDDPELTPSEPLPLVAAPEAPELVSPEQLEPPEGQPSSPATEPKERSGAAGSGGADSSIP
nr:DNA polymerase IV [Streptomyces tsukubensis NRRL18488]